MTMQLVAIESADPADIEPSAYLKYLPAIYQEKDSEGPDRSPFIGRFLHIFEDVLTPIEQLIGQIELYFDPEMTPEGLLPWLASWVGLTLDEAWPLERRRQLVGSAVELFQLRGTRKGLTAYLRIYTGAEPVIVEHIGGIRLGRTSQLGWNTVLGDGNDHCLTVVLELTASSAVDIRKVREIIEAEKPAHVAYKLEVIRKEDTEPGQKTA